MIKSKLLILSLALLLVCSCGYYQAPLAPELLAPKAIKNLTFKIEESALKLNWEAPDEDFRGEKLKYIKGYRIERIGPVEDRSKIGEKSFKLLAIVPDKHLKVRKELREEAIKKGELSRKIEAPEELTKFEYTDKDLILGGQYLYRIIPFYSRADGVVEQLLFMDYQEADSRFGIIVSDTAITSR